MIIIFLLVILLYAYVIFSVFNKKEIKKSKLELEKLELENQKLKLEILELKNKESDN
ncbi:hypothetical protein [Spiroplasma citri]|uniref:Plectrovirus-related protein n=1 Tax=Spiroplasma citri TaxID=2133 RepID=A0AAX3SXR4_SPICI|nr:hypothetical protein [Spiroplasma citri]WFG95947.1 hypothetical protein M0C40_07535 [Spiroplasma citri]